MIRKNHIVKIHQPGGIVSIGSFYAFLCAAEKAKVKDVQFGIRQQLYCVVSDKHIYTFMSDLKTSNIVYEVNKEDYQNIVSSYVTEEVFQHANWLSEGVYKDILEYFDFTPKLKINIVDSNQTFVPYFSGHINFISSEIGNYWFLYLRLPKTNKTYCWPALIYSKDIPKISRALEEIILNTVQENAKTAPDFMDFLFEKINKTNKFITQNIRQPLQIPSFVLPYYEGFNRYGNKTWLGIYQRDELFSVAFLKDVCHICFQTKIGQIHATPWKSVIVKGIQQSDRQLWDYVLNKHRINVGHASNELNWQIEDMCRDGLVLKRHLVRQFDKEDLRTFGLCFAIKTESGKECFGSILIRRQVLGSPNKRYVSDRYKYDLLYTNNFNPNSKEYILFRNDIKREELSIYLVALCKYYYETMLGGDFIPNPLYWQSSEPIFVEEKKKKIMHQCVDCLTVYDQEYGDMVNDILPGIPFNELDERYHCPTCGSAKSSFSEIEKEELTDSYGK
jgi:rubredoxin